MSTKSCSFDGRQSVRGSRRQRHAVPHFDTHRSRLFIARILTLGKSLRTLSGEIALGRTGYNRLMDKLRFAVLGLGAMGSAAAFQLAKRGRKVWASTVHAAASLGSSHGETRITRLAIGEGEHYTPLVLRSHELWREIGRRRAPICSP